ncbi:hypothetical protein [Halorubellus litoreus]|uniref:Uncharacterized protein n=1 Tax=Halorubellus litoreus TaxID=755308 RepID=A0ABD5VMI5_9EURY
MTEIESPARLVSARAASLARATESRLDGPVAMERPRALGSGFGAGDVGVPSLVAALVVETMQDGTGGGTAGSGVAGSEPPAAAVRTGLAVEALDRQGQALATVPAIAAREGDGSAVTESVLWCDWLHARAHELLVGGSERGERVVSAVRSMGREVASRNERREPGQVASEPVVAVPSSVVDEGTDSVIVRGSGCSCAMAARIGGLVGGARPDVLDHTVTYGELVDESVREFGRQMIGRLGGTAVSGGALDPAVGVAGGAGVVQDDVEGCESAGSSEGSDSLCWQALWWLLLAVDGGASEMQR